MERIINFFRLPKFQINSLLVLISIVFFSCNDYYKNDFNDNTPTSGKLNVYYDEALQLHVKSQTYGFLSRYKGAEINLYASNNDIAVQKLFTDSCRAIIISRPLNKEELAAFRSKQMNPEFSIVAKSGVALITNINTPLSALNTQQVYELLTKPFVCKDSISNDTKITVLLDNNNSSVMHYLKDSVLKGTAFSANCNVLKSSYDAINYVAKTKNTIAFIDFAWLSDIDDSLYKANKDLIKYVSVGKVGNDTCYAPNQSSFKLGKYPYTTSIYIYRSTGDFALAKGFESFIASPVGQTTFLKQGLLPTKQQERVITVNLGQ